MIRQLYDYLHDPSWIPHWKGQIEYIEGVLCREKWTGQGLAVVTNQVAFLQWRINQTMRLPEYGLGLRQNWQLTRLKGMLEAWLDGKLFFEPETPVFQVSWELLEPSGDGKYWQQIVAYNDAASISIKERRNDLRLKLLDEQKPDMIFRGTAGFAGYWVFIFDRGKAALLDSAFLGNALYYMPSSKWHELSKLSKTQLLTSHTDVVQKIVHPHAGWPRKLRRHLVSWGIKTL
jgi:hypothetical protein